ncbi:MAG: TonB-dependent receptor, partial [Pseudomonadota bacterium]
DIPGLPEHNAKLGGSLLITDELLVGVDLRGATGVHLRGDEANVDDETASWFVADLYAAYNFNQRFRIEARVDNVFDREYETFGLYGEADEVLEDPEDESGRFLGPAAPRYYWLTLALDW